ncbi:MAG: hypothetical protein ACLRTT_01925 [Lachnospiraceae bacterium]
MAYPPNKISKTGLKMQAFSACFMKFCLALNNYKKEVTEGSAVRYCAPPDFLPKKGKREKKTVFPGESPV